MAGLPVAAGLAHQQHVAQVRDVAGGQAQRLDLRELAVSRLGGDERPQRGEGSVHAVGAVPLPRVGCVPLPGLPAGPAPRARGAPPPGGPQPVCGHPGGCSAPRGRGRASRRSPSSRCLGPRPRTAGSPRGTGSGPAAPSAAWRRTWPPPSAPPPAAHAAGPRGRAPGPGRRGSGAPTVAVRRAHVCVPGCGGACRPGLYSDGGPSPAQARPPPRLPAPGGLRSGALRPSAFSRHAEGAGASSRLRGMQGKWEPPHGWFWGSAVPASAPQQRREGQMGPMTPAFSSGMTKSTQLPWPRHPATPCLSLPPVHTWFLCARRAGEGAQRGTEGLEFSPGNPPHIIPGVPWGTCTCPRLHPPGPAPALPSRLVLWRSLRAPACPCH